MKAESERKTENWKKKENVKEEGGIELRMGVRQERDNKRKHGYTTHSLRRACLWQGLLSMAATITRQELSPKVLLIAGESHLVPQ